MRVSIISIGVRTISISMISKVTISISTEVCNLLSVMGTVDTLIVTKVTASETYF